MTSGKALDELKAKIAPTLGVDPMTLVASNGRIHVKEDPGKGMAWREACKLLGMQPIAVDGEWEGGLSASGTSGVQFAEVEVDIETGVPRSPA